MTSALLIIDMVNDFITGTMKNDRATRVIEPISELKYQARQNDVPIIYVSDAHVDGDNELKIWGNHSMKGTWGGQIIDELTPDKSDITIEKHNYSAFYNTDLQDRLKKLNVDNLIITGVLTDICIEHTSADAFYRGYGITIPRETTEASSAELYKNGLKFMEDMYGANIVYSEEIFN